MCEKQRKLICQEKNEAGVRREKDMSVCAALACEKEREQQQVSETQIKSEGRGFNPDGFLVSASSPNDPFCPGVL